MPVYRLACDNGHEGDYLATVDETVVCRDCGGSTRRIPQPFQSEYARKALEDERSAEFKHAMLNKKFLDKLPPAKREAEFVIKESHMPTALKSKFETK
jgi:hypothetical protein